MSRTSALTRGPLALAVAAGALAAPCLAPLSAHADAPVPPLPPVAPPVVQPPSSTPAPSSPTPAPAPAPGKAPAPQPSAPAAPPPQTLRVESARLHGHRLRVRFACTQGGTAKLTDSRHHRLAKARFACHSGHATAAFRLRRAVSHRGLRVVLVVRGASVPLTLRSGQRRLASASTSTYCEYNSASGLPLCYEYWLNTWGPQQYAGYWIWGGQVSMWLSGAFQGAQWWWYYWDGSRWIGYAVS